MELINTLDRPGEFDALQNLRPDEPYFLLVGRDRLAPPLVQQWADDNRKRTVREFEDGHITEERRDAELRKSTQAESIGWAMVAYKAGHRAEVLTSGEKETYTGHKLDAETLARDRLQSQKATVVSALHNAIAEATDLQAMLVERGEGNPDLAALMTAMRKVADSLTPKRPGAR